MLNIAPAYFIVNYSDVNCIVNKAATFLSFPIILINCGCGEQRGRERQWKAKVEAWLRLPRVSANPRGVVDTWPGIPLRQEAPVPSPELQGGYWGGGGGVKATKPVCLTLLFAIPNKLLRFLPARAANHGRILILWGLSGKEKHVNVA